MLGFGRYMNNFDSYHKAVSYIESLGNLPLFAEYMSSVTKVEPKIYLERMNFFLGLLGNPQNDFKFIHVTGTSGKGTVSNMIARALFLSGKKTGLFTSPHVVTPIEKIQVDDLYIDPIVFSDLVQSIKPAIDQAYVSGKFGRPSHFEIYFAVALLYFKKMKCEYVVLEVGCGGRFDATNIIKSPIVSVITCIDFDHTEILGKTLKKIAYDKAGIIKKDSKFFTTEQRPVLLKMFSDISKKVGATFESVVVASGENPNEKLVRRVGASLNLSNDLVEKAIKTTVLPARFEKMQSNPLVIIDGAHNRSKMSFTINKLAKEKYSKLILLCSIADSKDSLSILSQIIPLADEIIFTRFSTKDRKPAPPIRLVKESRKYLKKGVSPKIFLDSNDALQFALKVSKEGDCLLITGSFFLSGELRKHWIPEEKILEKRRSLDVI